MPRQNADDALRARCDDHVGRVFGVDLALRRDGPEALGERSHRRELCPPLVSCRRAAPQLCPKPLEQEVYERTRDFNKKHPHAKKLDGKVQDQLKSLRREQQEIMDLYQEITVPREPEGGKK